MTSDYSKFFSGIAGAPVCSAEMGERLAERDPAGDEPDEPDDVPDEPDA